MLKFPQFKLGDWIRTCQECGYKQVSKPPKEYKNESWRDLPCKKCKSEALDYGKENMEVIEEIE